MPDGSCDDDIAPQGYPNKKIDQQSDDRRVASHCRHRRLAGKLPDYRQIRRVEQLLQNSRRGKRDRVSDDFVP